MEVGIHSKSLLHTDEMEYVELSPMFLAEKRIILIFIIAIVNQIFL